MAKLDNPPFVHNWVRSNDPDLNVMTRGLVRLVDARIPYDFRAFGGFARDRLVLKTDPETLRLAAKRAGHKNSREHVADALEAFLLYDDKHRLSEFPAYDEMVAPYRLGRGLKVPVKPDAVVWQNGVLRPVFAFAWVTVPFNDFQRRLFMTVLEDAIFSLTDFQLSPCSVLFFPRAKGAGPDGTDIREPEVWNRGDYDLLSRQELVEQTEKYIQAVDQAKAILGSRKAPQVTEVIDELKETSLPLFDSL